jgi:hypothetical protein
MRLTYISASARDLRHNFELNSAIFDRMQEQMP